jgi:hypothetical protein
MFLHEIIKLSDKIQSQSPDQYPFNIPTIKHFDSIAKQLKIWIYLLKLKNEYVNITFT